MKTFGGKAPVILNLGTRWRGLDGFTVWLDKSTRYPSVRLLKMFVEPVDSDQTCSVFRAFQDRHPAQRGITQACVPPYIVIWIIRTETFPYFSYRTN
jgi:hypothetical protein